MVQLPNSTNIREIKFQTVVKGEKLSQAKYSNLAHLIKVCDISQWLRVFKQAVIFFQCCMESFLRKTAPTEKLKQFHTSYIIETNYCIQKKMFLCNCISMLHQLFGIHLPFYKTVKNQLTQCIINTVMLAFQKEMVISLLC